VAAGPEAHSQAYYLAIAPYRFRDTAPPPDAILGTVDGHQLSSDFDQLPPVINLTNPAGETRRIPIRKSGILTGSRARVAELADAVDLKAFTTTLSAPPNLQDVLDFSARNTTPANHTTVRPRSVPATPACRRV